MTATPAKTRSPNCPTISLGEAVTRVRTIEDAPPDDGKDPAAVALGRKGGLKGGHARAAKMTPEERKLSAQKAAAARWGKEG